MKLLLALVFAALGAHADTEMNERWKTLLLDVVNINSSSDNPQGLEAVRQKLLPEFAKLGFHAQVIDAGQGHKVAVLRFPGAHAKVALIGHLDTVFPKDSPFQKAVVEGEWLHGPGAFDMKGGVVLMLDALNAIQSPDLLKQVVVLLNDDEEVGSPRSAPLLKAECDGVTYGLIFEGTSDSANSVTVSESGVSWLEVDVAGQAAHAGINPEEGLNACVELAAKIGELNRLNDYKHHLSVNTGVIQGGTKPNVICEQASAKLDIRFMHDGDLQRVRASIDRIVGRSLVTNVHLKRGAQGSVKELVFVPSMAPEVTAPVFAMAKEEAKKLGFDLKGEHLGGASDGNQLAPTGLKMLVGVGPYGRDAHSEKESLDMASYGQRKALATALIRRLLN